MDGWRVCPSPGLNEKPGLNENAGRGGGVRGCGSSGGFWAPVSPGSRAGNAKGGLGNGAGILDRRRL